MSKNGGGAVVNISSDLGIIAPDQRIYKEEGLADDCQSVKPVTYSVIKHGLIGLTKYTATYWADKGVRCNAIAPGGVYNDQPDGFVNKLKQLIPLGRMANEDEYKGSIQFLLSSASSYMTGTVLVVDGGRSCW
ncbi:MAG: SDR family oxidoreductase [Candidatus Peribacteraceae bacterium]|jgi:NAD(P)-dependent dehydrogenase (short-subunit alcohol dehydrogenase family)|nr:SDR family oxidoreductase [Candidatus Peribacteraceae bacterium]|tara:strand:+ start:714 stop:1112 length:399 start_codon:yes stop_codon:yes gene_type:complete